MKKQTLSLIILIGFFMNAHAQVGITTATPHNTLDLGTSLGSSITDVAGKKLAVYNDTAGNDFYGLGNSGGILQFHAASTPTEAPGMVLNSVGNVGIGNTAPTTRLEVSSGTAGTSGLKFTNMNSSSPATANTSALGVDATGNVVVQNATPLTTGFKSFTVDANVPTNSVVTIGNLEFRYPTTTCTSVDTFIQVRSTTGANNIGIVHAMSRSSQSASAFVNTIPTTFTTTFANLGAGAPTSTPALLPVNCVQDGAAQFTYFSYTDRTYYRVSFHVADGDSLPGFGAQGYIFVELQR